MEQVFRKVTPQEAMELESMFPGVRVDYSQFKVICDQYTQSTKTSVDTATDSRADMYIPPKATILKSWAVSGKVLLRTSAGAIDVAGTAVNKSRILNSTPEAIERVHILHGNSSGEILWECTNNFHALASMRMQGMKDTSEYSYFVVDGPSDGIFVDTKTGADGINISLEANDAGIPTEYQSQLFKMQKERNLKYRSQGRLAGDYQADNARLTILSSDLLPGKVPYFPLLLSSRGITVRMDLRTDAFHTVPKRITTATEVKDAQAAVAVNDLKV